MLIRILFMCLMACFITIPAFGQFGNFLEGLLEQPTAGSSSAAGLGQDKMISGLKEALQVGAEKAVALTGVENGYLGNEAIKILMPDKLRMFDQALRVAGYGPQLDEFVVTMNRAAEQAAPLAKPIFREAITSMTIEDAKGILEGGETAATEYFKNHTRTQLETAFRPQVEQAMNQVGLVRQYKALMGNYQSLPFVQNLVFDLDQYVVDNSLEGLFTVLAEQERQIRTNPAARVTDLLKEVFAK